VRELFGSVAWTRTSRGFECMVAHHFYCRIILGDNGIPITAQLNDKFSPEMPSVDDLVNWVESELWRTKCELAAVIDLSKKDENGQNSAEHQR